MKKTTKSKVFYIVGSLVLAAGAMVVLPKVIDAGSDYLCRRRKTNLLTFDEEFVGPEIVKTSELKKEIAEVEDVEETKDGL